MPVYIWKGLEITGHVRRGKQFARSTKDLEAFLLKQGIGLLHVQHPLFQRKIAAHEKNAVYSHISSLLNAHIPLHKALVITASTSSKVLKDSLHDCALLIEEGIPLSEAFAMHGLSDNLSHTLLLAAERTGILAKVMSELAAHMTIMHSFRTKIRASLLMPFITLTAFLAVMLGIFTLVIPRFEGYFTSYSAPLPFITRSILAISTFIRSFYMIYTIIGYGLAITLIHFALKRIKPDLRDSLLVRIPGIRLLFRLTHTTHFLITLSVLMKNSIPLAQALDRVAFGTNNRFVKREIETLRRVVEAGELLSVAIGRSFFACAELEAFLAVGEYSGSLENMISHQADAFRQKLYALVARGASLAQPLLLIILGILIACLICAIYMPLLTLSTIIE